MKNSSIEWTTHTFNPWIGCTKVSRGCKMCYAETLMDTRYGRVKWGKGRPRQRTSESYWSQPISWNRKSEREGTFPRVFCASLADVFDAEVSDSWRKDLFSLISDTPRLTWLLLTKRPENIRSMVDSLPENVWMGTSCEDQETADYRIPRLLSVPSTVHFLSLEPLLGPVNIDFSHCPLHDFSSGFCVGHCPSRNYVTWAIVGGESGQGARPMNLDWARDIRDQCHAAGVPYFFKQTGGTRSKGGSVDQIPEDLRIREFPVEQR